MKLGLLHRQMKSITIKKLFQLKNKIKIDRGKNLLKFKSLPSFFSMAIAIRLAMPIAASPAPWNRNVWSDILVLVALREAKRPATATEAVPGNKINIWVKLQLHSFRQKSGLHFRNQRKWLKNWSYQKCHKKCANLEDSWCKKIPLIFF